MNAPAPCHCAECQRLDSQPLRLHGIPHARQDSFLNSPAYYAPAPVVIAAEAMQRPVDGLPLFSGLAGDLFG